MHTHTHTHTHTHKNNSVNLNVTPLCVHAQIPDIPKDTRGSIVVVLDEQCVEQGSPARVLTGPAAAAYLTDEDYVEQPLAAEAQ